jgi:hypothetical protein
MKFSEVVSRVTGLSVPIFGVQWNPPEAECTAARRILVFLEDRRVLFVPSEMELPDRCVSSVLKIREFMTSELAKLSPSSELALSLRAMRAACRKFLSTVEAESGSRIIVSAVERGHWASWVFNGAVGELRGTVGVHLARIAAAHGLDVEDHLATILPASANDA